MPPLPLEATHSITLVGIFYLEHVVCVATYLPQDGFKCAVDLVSLWGRALSTGPKPLGNTQKITNQLFSACFHEPLAQWIEHASTKINCVWRGINDSASPLQALSHAGCSSAFVLEAGWPVLITSANMSDWAQTWPYTRGLWHSTTGYRTSMSLRQFWPEIFFRRWITVLMKTPRIDPTSPERWLLWRRALSTRPNRLGNTQKITDQLFVGNNWSVIFCVFPRTRIFYALSSMCP